MDACNPRTEEVETGDSLPSPVWIGPVRNSVSQSKLHRFWQLKPAHYSYKPLAYSNTRARTHALTHRFFHAQDYRGVWWLMPISLTLGKLNQERHVCEARLVLCYRVSSCVKKNVKGNRILCLLIAVNNTSLGIFLPKFNSKSIYWMLNYVQSALQWALI